MSRTPEHRTFSALGLGNPDYQKFAEKYPYLKDVVDLNAYYRKKNSDYKTSKTALQGLKALRLGETPTATQFGAMRAGVNTPPEQVQLRIHAHTLIRGNERRRFVRQYQQAKDLHEAQKIENVAERRRRIARIKAVTAKVNANLDVWNSRLNAELNKTKLDPEVVGVFQEELKANMTQPPGFSEDE